MKNIGQGLTYKISVTLVYSFRFWKNSDNTFVFTGHVMIIINYIFSFHLDESTATVGEKCAIK